MNVETKESNVVVKQLVIDGAKFKKSQIEQLPYIDEGNWVRSVRDGSLEIVCSFSPQLYNTMAIKRNKALDTCSLYGMATLHSTDSRSNRGLILHDKKEGILALAVLRDNYLTCYDFEEIEGVDILKVLTWIQKKPYIADL